MNRYFYHDTRAEIENPTIMNTPPSAWCVIEHVDGTFSSGIYHGYATPLAAIEAHDAGLQAAYAKVEAQWVGKRPTGHCHYCGAEIYGKVRYGFFSEDVCDGCR